MILEESLRFDALSPLPPQQQAETDLDPVRPVKGGLQWCAVPSETTGIAYLCTASRELLAISFDAHSNDPDEGPTVLYRITLPEESLLLLHCAASADGRLVAVACGDGSIRCYNALANNFTERWVLPDAHSHRLSTWKDTVGASRMYGAAASGPLRSLAFDVGTQLLWVDDASFQDAAGNQGKGLQIVEAAVDSTPTAIASLPSVSASCAAWSLTTPERLAVGTTEGQVFLVQFQSHEFSNPKSVNFEEKPEEASCNHVVWLTDDRVGASFVVVTPEDDDDDDDEEEEDDSASHEVSFYVLQMDLDSGDVKSSTDLGDVVSFFSVPKAGRHVFVTAFLSSNVDGTPLILVATNVASDIGVITKEDASNNLFG